MISVRTLRRTFSSAHGVKKLGIVGAGQMGTGVGIVAARMAGIKVCFVDPSESSLKKSQTMIDKWCDKEIKKERMTPELKGEVMQNIAFHDQISFLNDVDFVVEAATENFSLKKTIF